MFAKCGQGGAHVMYSIKMVHSELYNWLITILDYTVVKDMIHTCL